MAFRNAAHGPVAPDRRRKRSRAVMELRLFFKKHKTRKASAKGARGPRAAKCGGQGNQAAERRPRGWGLAAGPNRNKNRADSPPLIARVAFQQVWRGMCGMVVAGIIVGKNEANRRQFAARWPCPRSTARRPRQCDARRCRHRPASASAPARRRRAAARPPVCLSAAARQRRARS